MERRFLSTMGCQGLLPVDDTAARLSQNCKNAPNVYLRRDGYISQTHLAMLVLSLLLFH